MTYFGMDNFALRVVGAWDTHGDDDLVRALSLALRDLERKSVVGWAERDGALFLFWTIESVDDAHPFPAPIRNVVELHALVVGWLDRHPPASEMDPGSDTKEIPNGFEAWTDQWGHGGGDWRAFVAIKPRTRWIGK